MERAVPQCETRHLERLTHGSRGALIQRFEQSDWDIELRVTSSVRIQGTVRVFDEHCRAFRDPVHDAEVLGALDAETHAVAGADAEFCHRAFARCDELMSRFGMSKELKRERLKTRLRATRIIEHDHLREMNEFVLEDPLQRLDPIAAFNARHGDGAINIAESCEEQR